MLARKVNHHAICMSAKHGFIMRCKCAAKDETHNAPGVIIIPLLQQSQLNKMEPEIREYIQ